MAKTTGRLLEGKPIIEIAIADAIPIPLAVSATPAPLPFPLRPYRALLDTGADITCLCDHVVKDAKLRSYGMTQMRGGNGVSIHITYIIQMGIWCAEPSDFEGDDGETRTLFQLPDPYEAPAIRDNSWFDVIIGTDILVKYDFHLRKGGEFTLTLS